MFYNILDIKTNITMKNVYTCTYKPYHYNPKHVILPIQLNSLILKL